MSRLRLCPICRKPMPFPRQLAHRGRCWEALKVRRWTEALEREAGTSYRDIRLRREKAERYRARLRRELRVARLTIGQLQRAVGQSEAKIAKARERVKSLEMSLGHKKRGRKAGSCNAERRTEHLEAKRA